MTDHPSPETVEFAANLRETRPAYPAERFHGRGIVIVAGGAQIFTNAYVLISVLRRTLACVLPIEVWHFGAQEMSHSMAALLREMDVTVVDAFPRVEAAGATITDGWQLKPFALAQSGFAEVLMLDADQVPVRDPTQLFEAAEYREAGAVFWPDLVALRRDNPVWEILGLVPMQPEMSIESGQLLVDKRRHWRALAIAMELSQQRRIIESYVYGDKDLFLLAWLLAEASYALVPQLPLRADAGLYQHDFAGALLFQHRTGSKFAYATDEPATDGFLHLDACNSALATLRQRWNGRIFWPPDRSAAARATESTLADQGRFRLEVLGSETVDLELWPFGEFGSGRSTYRQNWWCQEHKGSLELLFRDGERLTYRLRPQADGTWQGERLLHREAIVTLVPRVPAGDVAPVPGLVDQLLTAIRFPTAGSAEWERFCIGIELLSRVDPSVLARLDEIAGAMAPEVAARLVALAQGIRAARTTQPSRAPPGTLKTYYRRLDGDDPA